MYQYKTVCIIKNIYDREFHILERRILQKKNAERKW